MADDMKFETFEELENMGWDDLEKKLDDDPDQKEASGGGAKEGKDSSTEVDISYIGNVPIQARVRIAKGYHYINDVLNWGKDSIIELEKMVGEPVELTVKNKVVAEGEVVVVNEKFALKITRLLTPEERLNELSL